MAKKIKKKATRCVRKTKEGKRCKGKPVKGRKTCMAHGPKRKKTTRKKATRKKVVRKKRAFPGVKCKKILVSGKQCACYCEPGGVYCATHRKKARISQKKIRKNPNPQTINVPF